MRREQMPAEQRATYGRATITFIELLDAFGGEPIPNCPGRYVLRRVGDTDAPATLFSGDVRSTIHRATTAHDTVVVTWLDGWGLISYARVDGTWCHTANDADGFRRKLAELGIPGTP